MYNRETLQLLGKLKRMSECRMIEERKKEDRRMWYEFYRYLVKVEQAEMTLWDLMCIYDERYQVLSKKMGKMSVIDTTTASILRKLTDLYRQVWRV